MIKQTTHTPDDARFGDIYLSRFYTYGTEIHLPHDPVTPEAFARAQSYLEAITHQCLTTGIWDKQPADIVRELAYHNDRHRDEVELARKAGENQAGYHEITIQQLQALSKRRVLAYEDTGWEVTHNYRIVCYFDHLIAAAIAEEEEIHRLTEPSQEARPTGETGAHN